MEMENNVASKEVMDALREYVLSKGEHIKIDYNYEEDIASKEVRDALNNLFQEVEKKVLQERIVVKELTEDIENVFSIVKTNIVDAIGFVWDECHKIYIVEDIDDLRSVRETWGEDTTIHSLKELPYVWSKSCPLRFISNWKLDKHYVSQCNNAMFEFSLWEDLEYEDE